MVREIQIKALITTWYYVMNINNYIEIKELTKEVIQQYLMNQYPWGIITRPLTPVAMAILSITYAITVAMLVLSLIQISVFVRYGITSLRYLKTHGRIDNSRIIDSTHGLPFVSVLIPIKNEDILTVKRSIRNMAVLNYPRNLFEVLFISDDPEYYVNSLVREIIPLADKLGINVRVIRREVNKGYKGGALNYGIKYAKGSVIAVFDVDTVVPSDYLIKAVNALLSGYDTVTGVWKGYYTSNTVVSKLLKFIYDVYNEVFFRGRFLSGSFPALTGNNIVIWRNVLESVGGFCECTGEDLDITIRLRAKGYRVGLIDSDVYVEVPQTYLALKKQYSRWLFSSIWNFKHNLRLLLSSKDMTIWEKVDGILWMLQLPSLSFAALSILITVILSVIGILVPPMPILLLETLNAITVLSLAMVLWSISRRVGYSTRDFLINTARSALLAMIMSFPMLIYSVESLITDEWEWIPTPKGYSTYRYPILRGLVHELSITLMLAAVMVILILNDQLIFMFYIADILAILLYGFSLVIPRR